MTVKYVSDIMGVNPETVRRWIRTGELKAFITSKKKGYQINVIELYDFVDRHPKYHYGIVKHNQITKRDIKTVYERLSAIVPIILMNHRIIKKVEEES